MNTKTISLLWAFICLFGISFKMLAQNQFQPSLIWAANYGSGGVHSNGVTTDASGNVYITGNTTVNTGIATSGAYQTSYAGGNGAMFGGGDAFLAKFNSSGTLIWATYFGGSGDDDATGISTDVSGNVYITGRTTSTGMATSGAYQTSYAGTGSVGDGDAFLAKFSSSGSLLWATYYGGSSDDAANGVSADGSGNIYITGVTRSSDGIASSGAYQTSYGGGGSYYYTDGDAFLAKFSSAGALSWATYFGGSKDDAATGISADGSDNVYITGQTNSGGLATSGAFQTSTHNTFLAKFSSTGAVSWATYFGGNSWDFASGIKADASGSIYITGVASSDSGLATSGAYKTSFEGNPGIFLAKFSSAGAESWATYYGGSNDNSAGGITTDGSGNVYIAGSTKSSTDIATKGAYQTSYGGGSGNSFLAQFSSAGTELWATYYNGGGGVAADGSYVYITGTLSKFRVKPYADDAGLDSIKNPSDPICAGTYPVEVHLLNTGSNPLTSAVISWTMNGAAQPNYNWLGTIPSGGSAKILISHFNFPFGTEKIKAWVSKPNGKADTIHYIHANSDGDTAYLTVRVYHLPAAIGYATSICTGGKANIGVSANGDNFNWTSNPSGFAATTSYVLVSPTLTTAYILMETTPGTTCTTTDTIHVIVNPLPIPKPGNDRAICLGDSATIGSSATTGHVYSWISNPTGFTSASSEPIVHPVLTTVYILKETTTATGCSNSDSVKITVNPLPNALWSVTNVDKKYYFRVADSSLTKSSYTWNFGDGSAAATGFSITHIFPKNIKYTVKLTVTNSNGCTAEQDFDVYVTVSGINSSLHSDPYNLSLYPNPFTDKILINFTLPQSSHVKISIMDMKGNEIFTPTDKTLGSGPNQVELNASEAGLSAGTYFVNIEINDQFISKKIIELR